MTVLRHKLTSKAATVEKALRMSVQGVRKPRRNIEAQLQSAIVQYLRMLAHPDCIWYAIPNGEHRSPRTGARLKAQGVLKGAPDLAFVLPNGQPAYIELKAPGGRLSPEQRIFMDRCVRLKVDHAVIGDIDTALATLTGWGALLPINQGTPRY